MKKTLLLVGILAGMMTVGQVFAYASSDAVTAVPNSSVVKIDGAQISFSSYNIGGYNYFRLRDIASAVNFNVGFDPHLVTVLIDTTSDYVTDNEQPAGKALSPVITVPVPIKVKADGTEQQMTSYNIDGYNYLRLRDIASAANFGVDYDQQSKTILISASGSYAEPSPAPKNVSDGSGSGVTRTGTFATTNADGSINIPQTDQQFVPNEGDVIRCDDGTNYTIKDMSRYDKSMFASGPLGPLPSYDTSAFTKAAMPEIEVRRYNDQHGDDLFIFNAYESRRLEYTLYNLIKGNSETWRNGGIAISSKGNPLVTVKIGIAKDDVKNFSCWPYREEAVVKYFNKGPLGHYKIDVWDHYSNGIYQYTEYTIAQYSLSNF